MVTSKRVGTGGHFQTIDSITEPYIPYIYTNDHQGYQGY